ncbi:MAG UNVERIFIED_CONTAM: hypothetical protein LVR18_21200 [Planctomycetaceae bacterium]
MTHAGLSFWPAHLPTALGHSQPPSPIDSCAWLTARTGPDAAASHYEHAVASREEFRRQVERDMQVMQQDPATFRFYMNFGFEIMDGYGRLLCMLNRNQPSPAQPTPRPPTYNLRLLERGRAFPYFIWPNVNPWERPETVEEAVIPPRAARKMAEADSELTRAACCPQSSQRTPRNLRCHASSTPRTLRTPQPRPTQIPPPGF